MDSALHFTEGRLHGRLSCHENYIKTGGTHATRFLLHLSYKFIDLPALVVSDDSAGRQFFSNKDRVAGMAERVLEANGV